MDDKIELTDAQKEAILKCWNERDAENPPSLDELVFAAFQQKIDVRKKEGRAVREFLATRNLKAPIVSNYIKKGPIELTSEQKEYIINNCATMRAFEMARVIFNDNTLQNLSREVRAVLEFKKSLTTQIQFAGDEEAEMETYKPPTMPDRCIARINKYVHDGLDHTKLTGKQKKDIQTLIGFLHTYRFLQQIRSYKKIEDRELFESSFIRFTYDKSDLTEEEVDQYIVLCGEIVIGAQIQRHKEIIKERFDLAMEDTSDKRFVPMNLIEAMNSAQADHESCVGRQEKLLSNLKVKRSERLSKIHKENASVLNLVHEWKQYEKRQQILDLGDAEKEEIRQEIGKLKSVDDLKARIIGFSEDEALN